MSLPKVTVLYGNGSLLAAASAVDGISGIVGTGVTVGLLGTPKTVYNLADAEAQGFTEADEPDMYRHLKEFYSAVPGNQELHVMVVPDTMTLTQMLDNTNANGAKKLIANAQGRVRMLAVFRHPAVGYDGGENFIDSDVTTAIANAKVFAEARLAELIPLRILIEGRVENSGAANTLIPKNSTNGFAGVVLGGSQNDGSASVGLALGRAAASAAQVKIGRVASGPLPIDQVYIGTSLLKDVANLPTLHDNGFISFMTHPHKAGFYFGIDRMCSIDDYRLLAYGRVIDKAAVIAAAVYAEQIEDTVETEPGGTIATSVASDLEREIEQQINAAMGAQISAVKALIDREHVIIGTDQVKLKLRIRPLGYKSFIEVDLGLTTE